MEIKIIAFGKIADITARTAWTAGGAESTARLREQLEAQYPALRGMSYQMAVNRKVAAGDTPLTDGAEVALLPPFSGG